MKPRPPSQSVFFSNGSLRQFQNQNWTPESLRYLLPTFTENIKSTFLKFGDRHFVTAIGDGSAAAVDRTYSEFQVDVMTVLEKIETVSAPTILSLGTNTYSHMVQIMATLLAGKTLALINPRETPSQIARKTAQLGAVATMTEQETSELLRASVTPSRSAKRRKERSTPPNQIAAQVFTSGTTGYSKVVCLSAPQILSNVDALIELHALGATGVADVIATPLPLFHVNALFFSFLCSFFTGGRLMLFEKFDPVQFSEVIAATHADAGSKFIVSAAPTILASLERSRRFLRPEAFARVTYFASAASTLDPKLLRDFSAAFSKSVIQGYGLSETVNFSTLMPTDLAKAQHDEISIDGPYTSIGKAVRGNEIFVVRPDGSPCVASETGELVVRGYNVMLGYLDDVQHESFRGSVFHTGDLGYFKEIADEIYFFISGRLKDVIKRAGQTISLREVDAGLAELKLDQTDAISFSFADPIVGEELGVALKFSSDLEDARTKVEDSFVAQAKSVFSKDGWPRVVLCTSEELRTPSGKPLRADLKRRFELLASHLKLSAGTENPTILVLIPDSKVQKGS
ncbi:acyl--CoA ligase [soil metagenome]